ncbi:MAG: histone deacetylase [Marteilia pararefringens]
MKEEEVKSKQFHVFYSKLNQDFFPESPHFHSDLNAADPSSISELLILRSRLTDELIHSYELLKNCEIFEQKEDLQEIPEEFCEFHSRNYLEIIGKIIDSPDEIDSFEVETLEKYGLSHDCFPELNLLKFSMNSTRLSIASAKWLISQRNSNAYSKINNTAVNFHGGWHHGQK